MREEQADSKLRSLQQQLERLQDRARETHEQIDAVSLHIARLRSDTLQTRRAASWLLVRNAALAILLVLSFAKRLQLTAYTTGNVSLPDFAWLLAYGIAAGMLLGLGIAVPLPAWRWGTPARYASPSGPSYTLAAAALCSSACAAWLVYGGGSPAVATGIWVLGLLLAIAATLPMSRQWKPSLWLREHTNGLWEHRWPILVLLTILGIAVLLRLPHLATVPNAIHHDEADNGIMARQVADGQMSSLFSLGWSNLPMLGYVWEGLFLKLFGDSLFSLRLASVVLGVGSIALLAMLGKEAFNRRTGRIAACLLAVFHLHINYSRQGHHFMQAVFTVTLTLYALVLALKRGSRTAAVLCGIALSVDLQVYFSARAALAAVPLILVAALLGGRRTGFIAVLKLTGWIVLGFVVASMPIAVVAFEQWQNFIERSRAVFIFNDTSGFATYTYHTRDSITILRGQLWKIIQTFVYSGDADEHYALWHPLLDPISGALFPAAFVYTVVRCRRPGPALCLAGFFAVVLLGGVLTLNPASWERLLPLTPLVALMLADFLDATWQSVSRIRYLALPSAAGMLVVLCCIGVGNYQWYFNDYIPTIESGTASLHGDVGRYLHTIHVPHSDYWVTTAGGYQRADDVMQYFDPAATQCLVYAAHPLDITQCPAPANGPHIFVLLTGMATVIPDLRRLYPRGSLLALKSYTNFGTGPVMIYRAER